MWVLATDRPLDSRPILTDWMYSITFRVTFITSCTLRTSVSIDIDEFEDKSETELADRTNAERVLRFLAENDDRAFKPAEIAERTGVSKNSIGSVLGRLEDRALVRHKGPYWAITDDEERLESFSSYFQTTSALNERLGEEDPDEWTAHAPDEPHPNADRDDEDDG